MPCTRLVPVSSATGNAFGMMIFYAIQAGLSFLIWGGMQFFSRYLPTEVPKLNCCIRLYGGLVRFFMDIQIKLHYVTFVQILLLWYSMMNNDCQVSIDFTILGEGGDIKPKDDKANDTNGLL
jgi:hypothetical protein